ncbi:MAG: SRPBCC family protein [Alphaproteobacteria bacterium]
MAKVSMSMRIDAPARQVWELVGAFNALPDWHPAVEKSEIEGEGGSKGTVRRLSIIGGGGTIVERLEDVDDRERRYSYSILQGPLPVANYQATIKVSEDEGGKSCTVEWSSEFDPAGTAEADAVNAIEGVYKAGLENLKNMFGG